MLELTNTEKSIMKCLWTLGENVTVADLLNCLKEKYQKEYARTTISVFMSYLRDKGYVAYEKQGHAYVYRALVSERAYQKEQTKRYLADYFDGDMGSFLSVMLENEQPDTKTSRELGRILAEYEAKKTDRE